MSSLKDQLEANIADLQARFDARPQGSAGNDWFQLSFTATIWVALGAQSSVRPPASSGAP